MKQYNRECQKEGGLTSGVYLPVVHRSDAIRVGKTIEITIGNHTVEYTICGFFNSVMTGSHNCSLTEIILTEDKYDGPRQNSQPCFLLPLPGANKEGEIFSRKRCKIFEVRI